MKVCRYLFIVIIPLLLTCEVKFNPTLREYIDDVSARTPLRFTISDSITIDEVTSFSFGYSITTKQVECLITNTESKDITLSDFDGVDDDFTIAPFSSFILKSGETFSLPVTYNPSVNLGERVSLPVVFKDKKDREFNFSLWGTSNPQPLSIYSEAREKITLFDLGNWIDQERKLILKNEGLSRVEIEWIHTPDGIVLNSPGSFPLEINEEINLSFTYNDPAIVITDLNNTIIRTNYFINNEYRVTLKAGGPLVLEFGDSIGPRPTNSYAFASTPVGTDLLEGFYIKNITGKKIDVTVSINSGEFYTDLVATEIDNQGILNYNVIFSPTFVGTSFMNLNIIDSITNRGMFINFTGSGT